MMTQHQEAVEIKQEPDLETDDSYVHTEGLNARVHMADILDTKSCEDVIQPGLCVTHEGDKNTSVMKMVYKKDYTSVTVLTDNSCSESRPAGDSVVCHQGKGHVSGVGSTGQIMLKNEAEEGEEVANCENNTEMCGAQEVSSGDRTSKRKDCHLKPASSEQHVTPKRRIAEELPYICRECGAGFTDRSNLRRHKRIHTGEKPYKCDVCDVGFSNSSHLKSHTRIHTGEKPYTCDVCGEEFTYRSTLERHNKIIHTGEKPYKCGVCGGEFTEGGSLRRHKRIHTGEKPYKCELCSSEFSHRWSLTSHRRTHTGEKPYRCDVCGGGFSNSSNLKTHKKKIHKEEKLKKCDEVVSCFQPDTEESI